MTIQDKIEKLADEFLLGSGLSGKITEVHAQELANDLRQVLAEVAAEGRKEEQSRYPNPSHSTDEVIRLCRKWLPVDDKEGTSCCCCTSWNDCRSQFISNAEEDGYIISNQQSQ